MNTVTKPTTNKPSILKEIIEAFDLEWKIFHTFRDFFRKPAHVIDSYAEDKEVYSNPIKLLLICGTIYWLVSSTLIDWEGVSRTVGSGYAGILKSFILLIDDTPPEAATFDKLTGTYEYYSALVFSYLMQYLGIYVMVMALLQSTLLYKFTRKHGSSFRKIAGFLCYRASFFIVTLLVLLPFGYISYWLPVLLIMATGFYLEYSRKVKKFSVFSYLNVPENLGKKYQLKALLIIFGCAFLLGGFVGAIVGFNFL
ncbi:MAG: DUF3667 domain-containing protein [Candidatus Cyclobacteriaceae bacterium M2_1C_046]